MPTSLPKRIAYFITGHGYGHAVRSARLINALQSTSHVTVFTTVEKEFFQRELVAEFDYIELELDCGCVQYGALDVDVSATYERYAAIESTRPELLHMSCEQLLEQRAEFVIGDIPPLAFAAAARLGLPSLAVSNFTWAEIYAEYCKEDQRFIALLASIRQDYAHAGHYARLHPGISKHPFHRSTDVGLLCRNSARSREWLAERLCLDLSRKWCLIYIGAFGVEGVNWERLKHYRDWHFIGLYALPDAPDNYTQIHLSGEVEHSDILPNCDLVLGKLGYGLVSECLFWERPIAYPPRLRFAEHAALANVVQHYGIGFALTHDDLVNCRFGEALSWSGSVVCTECYKSLATTEILDLITTQFSNYRRILNEKNKV